MRTPDRNLRGTLDDAAELLGMLLRTYARVAVTGRPGVGKSRICIDAPVEYLGTDQFAELGWDEQADRVIAWAAERSRWLMEGVTVSRALRHGLAADAVLVLRGRTLRPGTTLKAVKLGDQVYKWVRQAQTSHPADFYFWDVVKHA